jgi:hypothetical protein
MRALDPGEISRYPDSSFTENVENGLAGSPRLVG